MAILSLSFSGPKEAKFVPCVIKAVHMIEVLREAGTGPRVENLQNVTGYPRTAIYRILRTLIACEYIRRDSGGSYRLNCRRPHGRQEFKERRKRQPARVPFQIERPPFCWIRKMGHPIS
jgi:hypothetical protein